jgi:hypothetical protein
MGRAVVFGDGHERAGSGDPKGEDGSEEEGHSGGAQNCY